MQLRRSVNVASSAEEQNTLTFWQLIIRHSTRSVILDDTRVLLTTSEFDLFWLLASNSEQILSRDYIYRQLRGIEYDGMDSSIDTKVAVLAKKLGDSTSLSKRIITLRGKG
ncbi:winged helix-turn-helix domain-containing protein [Colwelliaceae bacterium BS250]